jgi:hypothetical protein
MAIDTLAPAPRKQEKAPAGEPVNPLTRRRKDRMVKNTKNDSGHPGSHPFRTTHDMDRPKRIMEKRPANRFPIRSPSL